jgi:transporter family-2 protein
MNDSRLPLLAILVASVSGVAIGVQSALNTAAGRSLDAFVTGLSVNAVGGLTSVAILAVLLVRRGDAGLLVMPPATMGILLVAGLLGIGIISGIAYAFPRTGAAAGLAAVIASQILVAIVVDTFGLAGGQPISLSWTRVAGLAVLALGTWLILPRG